ncbi:phage tail protein [Formicincola oecophyllae]|uniref:Phage tail protein n=1 Tax=Formicincola oecophyllae TaxID=2558361 RepID=A0A4Y6UBW6_9PROT|nr:phage tail protein [Formicincola oecophyllae]QDH14058.1 phage tail protein [Formicincola oecophyllae]
MAAPTTASTLGQAPTGPKGAGNAPVLLMLGGFMFSLNTASFTKSVRDTTASWASVDRFGLNDLQFMGLEGESLELDGVLYPHWRGARASLEYLRQMMFEGAPQTMIGPDGFVLGRYVLKELKQEHTLHSSDGNPRQINFTITLSLYDLQNPAIAALGRNLVDGVWQQLRRYAGLSL